MERLKKDVEELSRSAVSASSLSGSGLEARIAALEAASVSTSASKSSGVDLEARVTALEVAAASVPPTGSSRSTARVGAPAGRTSVSAPAPSARASSSAAAPAPAPATRVPAAPAALASATAPVTAPSYAQVARKAKKNVLTKEAGCRRALAETLAAMYIHVRVPT